MQGKVRSLDKQGVGWITADDGSGDYFFHLMVVNRESEPLGVGDPVVFERKPGKKGNFAVNILKLKSPSHARDEIRRRRRASAGDPQPDALSPLKGYSTTPQDAAGPTPPATSKSDDLGRGFSPQEFDRQRTSPDLHGPEGNEIATPQLASAPPPLVGPIQYAWMRRRRNRPQ